MCNRPRSEVASRNAQWSVRYYCKLTCDLIRWITVGEDETPDIPRGNHGVEAVVETAAAIACHISQAGWLDQGRPIFYGEHDFYNVY